MLCHTPPGLESLFPALRLPYVKSVGTSSVIRVRATGVVGFDLCRKILEEVA